MALLEGTNLSEARGTARPFEMFGAPWLEPLALTGALAALELPGVSFLPTRFRPMFEKHAGETCGGAMLEVVNPSVFRPFETGLQVIETARCVAPREFRWREEPYEFDPVVVHAFCVEAQALLHTVSDAEAAAREHAPEVFEEDWTLTLPDVVRDQT